MIAVIKGCGANIASVMFALARLGQEAVYTDDKRVIQRASHVILPGVGTAAHAMQQLQQRGLVPVISQLSQPLLGICLGMQLLYECSAEGDVPCLGLLPGKITALQPAPGLSLPHMGWNQLFVKSSSHPLLHHIADKDYVYFVHSYCAPVDATTLASCDYGQPFSAIVARDNFFAMQFHPEKSAGVGLQLLKNFLTVK